MLKSFLICLLVGVCLAKELTLNEPYKPTSPTPLSPLLKALMNGEKKGTELIEDLEVKLTKSLESVNTVDKIVCGCENKCQQKTLNEIKSDLLTIEEIKQITNKLETILHSKIFKSIAKRSVDTDEHDETKSLLHVFQRVKDLFELDNASQVTEFHSKLMGMPDKKVPLNVLVELVTKTAVESTGDECSKKTKIECPIGHELKIHRAAISNKNKNTCPATAKLTKLSDEICTEETKTLKIVKDKCEGERMCKLSVDADFDGLCECSSPRYLNMTYSCEPVSEETNREKRSLHYRHRPAQIDRDRFLRRSGLGMYDYYYGYGPFDYYGFGPFDYYGFGPFDYYGFGPFDYYYGFGPFDYYYGFGPFDYYYDYPAYGAVIYDY